MRFAYQLVLRFVTGQRQGSDMVIEIEATRNLVGPPHALSLMHVLTRDGSCRFLDACRISLGKLRVSDFVPSLNLMAFAAVISRVEYIFASKWTEHLASNANVDWVRLA